MEDEYEPSWFHDPFLFLAVYEGQQDLQPNFQGTMQSQDCLSSQDTSSPTFHTPTSSTDLQEEARSPDRPDDSQQFHHEGLTTDPFSFLGGPTPPDLTDIEMNGFRDLESGQQTSQNEYVEPTQNDQLFMSQQHYPEAQIASAIQHGYVEGTYGLNPDYNLGLSDFTLEPTTFMNMF